ncbi:TetR/AcrR family transcriptional regulator [Limosilactobacillus fastidiosus]|uniref:TetR/AcrR family transcriptional regulator n=1 Tax=Limosilactobacillus fastidiosus TaxID=2759855 RepID=A0A7W3U159_9LACO|nr:TetR/AcrR family transcriptional regulator [Limosilactobacillus fastidiosus]MBB1086740.1 TetR/AcrR family transcriptional regulator [Limosilactobacillus fastidiosus]MCD7085533.1 TetR/AcrR family transcriptional regulator [Limosilactobacillus fastidiosus]MCD7114764.1 TetR/AcrR family transcriptional regulator [Limosilactobacillus fastidiosus]MCD7115987.1 TetR/AcrR family transcriptional regulator [Limosilactobacillus fastidiosus]
MAGHKTDPRVVKTRNNLRKALVYLMRREKLEDISVQKITETANITRGTFYLHYKDKKDFIKSAINDLLDDFFAQVMVESEDLSFTNGQPVKVFSLQKAFQYIENEADIFDVLLNNKRNDFFYEQLYDRLSDHLSKYYAVIAEPDKQPEVPLNLQISFIDSALLGLISHWLKDGMIYTSRYMTQSVGKMLDRLDSNNVLLLNFLSHKTNSALRDIQ